MLVASEDSPGDDGVGVGDDMALGSDRSASQDRGMGKKQWGYALGGDLQRAVLNRRQPFVLLRTRKARVLVCRRDDSWKSKSDKCHRVFVADDRPGETAP